MENASKALIIAGAILLSILIIALGMYVFNNAKAAMNMNQLDQVEIAAFNDPITMYEGKQIGSSIRTFIGNLISNATENKDSADRLPNIHYIDDGSNGPQFTLDSDNGAATAGTGRGWDIDSNVDHIGTTAMSGLRKRISNSHYYYITVEIGNLGLVEDIYICYTKSEWEALDPESGGGGS